MKVPKLDKKTLDALDDEDNSVASQFLEPSQQDEKALETVATSQLKAEQVRSNPPEIQEDLQDFDLKKYLEEAYKTPVSQEKFDLEKYKESLNIYNKKANTETLGGKKSASRSRKSKRKNIKTRRRKFNTNKKRRI